MKRRLKCKDVREEGVSHKGTEKEREGEQGMSRRKSERQGESEEEVLERQLGRIESRVTSLSN